MFEIGDRVEVIASDSPFERYAGQYGVVERITWDNYYIVLLDGKKAAMPFLPKELKKEKD